MMRCESGRKNAANWQFNFQTKPNMKKLLYTFLFLCSFTAALAQAEEVKASVAAPEAAAAAPGAEAAPAAPNLEQRVADIEAYFNEVARPSGEAKVASNIPGPGPGHNAWQMTSTALVLFMTLPGLALFYGGLVRRKNVLSVLAQCLGIAGMVTILWWVCGYSLSFSGGNSIIGNLDQAFFRGIES